MYDPNNPMGYMPEVPDMKDMSDKERDEMVTTHMIAGCGTYLVAGILGLLLCWLLTGCTTTRIVEVERVKTDTTYITQHLRDSVWLHDSIKVTEKGDTVRIEKWHTKYIEREVHDTTYVAKRDSIPVPYEVIKEVPRKVSKTERALMIAGILSMMAVIVFVVWKIKSFLPLR